jgi:hypothetical protein
MTWYCGRRLFQKNAVWVRWAGCGDEWTIDFESLGYVLGRSQVVKTYLDQYTELWQWRYSTSTVSQSWEQQWELELVMRKQLGFNEVSTVCHVGQISWEIPQYCQCKKVDNFVHFVI